jgi:hypothetical protein
LLPSLINEPSLRLTSLERIEAVLPATIVLLRLRVPPLWNIPPPKFAVLLVIVTLRNVVVPSALHKPPPTFETGEMFELPEMVELIIVTVPTAL